MTKGAVAGEPTAVEAAHAGVGTNEIMTGFGEEITVKYDGNSGSAELLGLLQCDDGGRSIFRCFAPWL